MDISSTASAEKKREQIGKMMSSDTYLKLSVTSVAKYNSGIRTWVVEHLCSGGWAAGIRRNEN
jgi:hypothetical protein